MIKFICTDTLGEDFELDESVLADLELAGSEESMSLEDLAWEAGLGS